MNSFTLSFSFLLITWSLVTNCLVAICPAENKEKSTWSVRKVEEYPAHIVADGLAIAADMITSESLSNQIFEYKNLVSHGIYPVLVVIENRGDFAVAIDGQDIYLSLADSKLEPLEIQNILGIMKAEKKSPGILRSPIPSFSKGDSKIARLEARSFYSKRIPPGVSDFGFLFYHSYSHDITKDVRFLYLPKITNMKTGQDMIYFEVPLSPVRDQKP